MSLGKCDKHSQLETPSGSYCANSEDCTQYARLWQSSAAADVGIGQENMHPHALQQQASHPGTPEGASKGQDCSSPSPAVLGPRTPANAD